MGADRPSSTLRKIILPEEVRRLRRLESDSARTGGITCSPESFRRNFHCCGSSFGGLLRVGLLRVVLHSLDFAVEE